MWAARESSGWGMSVLKCSSREPQFCKRERGTKSCKQKMKGKRAFFFMALPNEYDTKSSFHLNDCKEIRDVKDKLKKKIFFCICIFVKFQILMESTEQ